METYRVKSIDNGNCLEGHNFNELSIGDRLIIRPKGISGFFKRREKAFTTAIAEETIEMIQRIDKWGFKIDSYRPTSGKNILNLASTWRSYPDNSTYGTIAKKYYLAMIGDLK